MATKKDLVEAHAFSRRRLVTAFVSGAPGGREVEPVRPGRVIIGGVALSVLLLAGAAIAGFLLGRPPAEWLNEGSFVISKDTGEQYVVLRGGDDPMLQRVPNYVSAQLLIGEPDLTPYTVRDTYIRDVRLGEDLGIDRAPASLPDAEELVADGWTACTADGAGVKVAVQERREVVDVTESAFLVSTGRNRTWLVAPSPERAGRERSAYRFALPRNPVVASTMADRLGFDQEPPVVDDEWLNLFARGEPLEESSFGVPRSLKGKPARYASSETDLSDHRIGDLLIDPSGSYYLLGEEGPERLAAFPALVHIALEGDPTRIDTGITADFADRGHPEEWPDAEPEPLNPTEMCAVLHPGQDSVPTRTLAVQPSEAASSQDIGPGRHDVDVEPSGGAYVLSAGDESQAGGSPYVIDAKGARYELVGIEVPDYIGYGDVEPVVVPSAWLTFFDAGVRLSTNDARGLPADAPAPPEDEATGS